MDEACINDSFKINSVCGGFFRKLRDFQVIERFEKSTLGVKLWTQFVVKELKAL